jgi:hypothetical protein
MQNVIKLENISNLITSPSSYQCRITRLVHFVIIHGRHTSMECMCAYWGSPKVNFQNKWEKKLSYRIIRIKRIFFSLLMYNLDQDTHKLTFICL